MIDSPIVQSLIRTAFLPALGVGILLFLTGGMKEGMRSRLQAVIFASGFVVGAYLLIGRLGFPPHDANETFSWAAVLLAGFVAVHPKPLGPRYLLRALFVLALGALLLWPIRATITAPMHHRNLVAFFCLALGVWSIVERASGSVKESTAFLLPLICATGMSLLLVLKGSTAFSNLITILCCLMGAAAVLGFIFPKRLSVKALVPFISVFVILFMAAGLFYLEINPWWLIFMALPYLVLWVREWLSFVPQHPVAEGLILGAISAAPLAYFLRDLFVTAGPLY